MIPSAYLANLWNQQKSVLMAKFRFLTEQDLIFAEGKKDDMLFKLRIKLGLSNAELSAFTKTF